MGFSLIMYLSRSKTAALGAKSKKKRSKFILRDLKSSLTFSINPKVDIVAQWKKTDEVPPPKRTKDDWWPPREAESIAVAIEKALRDKNQVGSMNDFISKNFAYPCYKLSGFLTLDTEQNDQFYFRGISLNKHGLTGKLKLAGADIKISLILALENIAGVDPRDDQWNIRESGAMYLFQMASSPEGFPLFGLFTYEGPSTNAFASCGIVYFAAYGDFSRNINEDADEMNTLKSGIDVWPKHK